MDHAITVGDVLVPLMIIGGLAAFVGVLMFVVWLLNPFRSGH